jgi:hypothetical protein
MPITRSGRSRSVFEVCGQVWAARYTLLVVDTSPTINATYRQPWHSVPNWPDHLTGDEMLAAMDKVGVASPPLRPVLHRQFRLQVC